MDCWTPAVNSAVLLFLRLRSNNVRWERLYAGHGLHANKVIFTDSWTRDMAGLVLAPSKNATGSDAGSP